jgi:serine/threonine protein kinase
LETSLATARFGRYENAAHFGDGIFSEVFLAKASDQSLDTFSGHPGAYVALKVTYLAALIAPHNAEREARILRKASASNIIPLWESFHDGKGHLILVFPFIPFSLEQLLRDGRLSDAAKKSCLRDLFVALTHLHSLGIIHRDVKPSNILLESPSGRAYLSDFGIAWSPEDPASEEPTKKITDVGTTNYRPPELLFGYTSYDTTLDLWAAGCVVFEVVRGQNKSLFDSGDLGAELALIQSIFKTLGTPTADNWPVGANTNLPCSCTDNIRKLQHSQIGVRCSSTTILQSPGLS